MLQLTLQEKQQCQAYSPYNVGYLHTSNMTKKTEEAPGLEDIHKKIAV
jgi:hypothetical protein